MKETILIAISKWAVKNLNVSESLKNVGVEVLDKILWKPLKNKILGFFDSPKEMDVFVKEISEVEAVNITKPDRDVEDIYEDIKGVPPCKELFNTIAKFFSENQDLLKQINATSNIESSGTTIFNQKAKNIYNAQGTQIITVNKNDK